MLNFEKHKHKPRILWAGSASHIDGSNINNGKDDFNGIEKFVLSTLDDYQWVFYGASPTWARSYIMDGRIEFHNWTGITDFPMKIHNINANLVIAPLRNNFFNECKSNIKLTEAGAIGVAGVYQDIEPYKEAPLKFKTADEMADQIKKVLSDEDFYVKTLREMRDISEGYFLDNNHNLVYASIFEHLGSLNREVISPKLIEINR
jgi:hypothetical protein